MRKIIHVDMDAFFAAVEQRDFPQYRHQPLVVGGLPHSRGVVSTCSYEARQYGIHSAMPSSQAYRLCPQAIFVKPRFEAYREASTIIRKIFSQYTSLYEPLSLDEAYLDVTGVENCQGSATLLARKIKQEITQQTELIASAGISYNKFLAKIASDMDKPDGLYLIRPEQGESFVENLAVSQFHGVGKATTKKMQGLGIEKGSDLKKYSLASLKQHFGKAGLFYYNICRGIDLRPVNSNRVSKSVGVEMTFAKDILRLDDVMNHLRNLLKQALIRLEAKQFSAQTLTIKIKYYDFVQITRSHTLSKGILKLEKSGLILMSLLKNTAVGKRKVRLLGVSLSSLKNIDMALSCQQLDIFEG